MRYTVALRVWTLPQTTWASLTAYVSVMASAWLSVWARPAFCTAVTSVESAGFLAAAVATGSLSPPGLFRRLSLRSAASAAEPPREAGWPGTPRTGRPARRSPG
jgi:hypothetical protein